MAWAINNWVERYEVNTKNRAARDGDELRKRPLAYIRSAVHGHSGGRGWATLSELVGKPGKRGVTLYEVFGVFHKLLEFAADEEGGSRGTIRNRQGDPATFDEVATLLGYGRQAKPHLQRILDILTDKRLAWLVSIGRNPGKSGKIRESADNPAEAKIRENPGISGNPLIEGKGKVRDRDKEEPRVYLRSATEPPEPPDQSPLFPVSFASGNSKVKAQAFALTTIDHLARAGAVRADGAMHQQKSDVTCLTQVATSLIVANPDPQDHEPLLLEEGNRLQQFAKDWNNGKGDWPMKRYMADVQTRYGDIGI